MSVVAERTSNSRFFRFYSAGWIVLAALALTYMTILLFRPGWLPQSFVLPAAVDHESNRGTRDLSRALAELKRLRNEVGRLENELAETKAAYRTAQTSQQRFASRISALEKKAGITPPAASLSATTLTTGALKPDTSPVTPVAKLSSIAPAKIKIINSGAKKTAAKTKTATLADTHRVTTGSIAKVPKVTKTAKPVSFGKAVVRRKTAPAVQIASAGSMDAVRLSWLLLSDRHANLLSRLEPRIQTSANGRRPYRLVAGPLRTEAQARRLCAALRAQQVQCALGRHTGRGLR